MWGSAAILGLGAAADVWLFRRMTSLPDPLKLTCTSFTNNGYRGWVLSAGCGQPVVLIASMVVRARSYLPLIRELSKTHQVWVLEPPGSGRGSRLAEPWSVARYGEWVNAILEENDLRQLTLVGHSNSGPVAMDVALRSRRIANLVLVDSVGGRTRRGIVRVLSARVADGCQEMALNLRAWWHVAFNILVHRRSFFHQVRLGCNASYLGLAGQVTVPCVVAWGKRDLTMPLQSGLRLHRSIPQSQLLVARGSHDWLVTQPQAFTRLLFKTH